MNLMRNSQRTVKVSKIELLRTLRDNKIKHVEEFAEAISEYKLAVIAKAQEIAAAMSEAKNPLKVDVYINLQAPNSYESVYEEYIEMFNWDVQDEVVLQAAEFQNLVLDKWDWKAGFESAKTANRAYLAAAVRW